MQKEHERKTCMFQLAKNSFAMNIHDTHTTVSVTVISICATGAAYTACPRMPYGSPTVKVHSLCFCGV